MEDSLFSLFAKKSKNVNPAKSISYALFAALFCTRAKYNFGVYNNFRTLCAKHPGVTQYADKTLKDYLKVPPAQP